MSQSFLSRRAAFGLPTALLVLLVFFFLLPSAFRGARLAIAGKKNNIKDWLPSNFRETVELDWFASYFMGESFVVATWDGCTQEDQRLDLFSAKLRHESAQRIVPSSPDHDRARQLAEELRLFIEPATTQNWGGQDEKWFSSPSGRYYYITPDGRFYRWEEGNNAVGGGIRALNRAIGRYVLKGQFIAAFGEPSTRQGVNEFYNDPALLAASLFQSVETGGDLVAQLAEEGGPLWPIDLTDVDQRAAVARQRAIERLTGTLFGPAVPYGFDWSPASVYEHLPEKTRAQLPDDFDFQVRRTVTALEQRLGQSLQNATTSQQGAAWDELCQTLGIPVPPRQTCILVTLTQLGKDHLARAVGRGVVGGPRGRLLILGDQSGLSAAPPPSMAPPPFDRKERQLADASGRSSLRLGGPPIDNVAIDEEGTVTLVRLVGYSALVGLVLSFLCFRSVNLTVMIFLVGVSAAILGLAITYWTGGNVDAILMSMPSLVYVLGLSGAIHVVNYYRDEVRLRGVQGAPERAARHAVVPCTLAAITTSLGLISLCTSNIVPIYNFGLYAAAAVIATLLILFTYLPAALETFVPSFALRRGEVAEGSLSDAAAADRDLPPASRIADAWAAIGRCVTTHHVAVTVACTTVFALGLWGIPKIKTSVQLLKLFDSESRIIADYAYLEKNFGKLVPMEVVIRVPTSMLAGGGGAAADSEQVASVSDSPAPVHRLSLLQRARAVERIDMAVQRTLGDAGTGVIGQTMSAATFLPPLPDPGYSLGRATFERRLTASIDELKKSDFYRVERDGPYTGAELWRISLRVGALSDVDYGQFVGDLRKTVTPVLDAYRAREMILTVLDSIQEAAAPVAGRRPQPRILLVGHREPRPIESEEFLAVTDREAREAEVQLAVASGRQSDLIRSDRLYASTLAELLVGEWIKTPLWVDLDSGQAQEKLAQWQKVIEAVDLVVMLGDQDAIDAETLSRTAKRFVDARPAGFPEAMPVLIGNVPAEENAGPLQAVYTGIVPVVYKAQRTLLTSLIQSIVLAFFLIAFVMIALLVPGRLPFALLRPRILGCGVVAGMVAMVPNLFPVVVIFGFMGHYGTLVDIGTMMTASVAMGVAVDDTIHFLTWFRQHIDHGMTRVEAVIETYRRVGPAMTQTTIVGGLGLFVFALSTFTPTQRFGTLMLVLLAAALIGDLILLPALLAGPLGRWFRPRPPVSDHSPAGQAAASQSAPGDSHRDDSSSAAEAPERSATQEPAVTATENNPHASPPSPKGPRQPAGLRQSATRGDSASGREER